MVAATSLTLACRTIALAAVPVEAHNSGSCSEAAHNPGCIVHFAAGHLEEERTAGCILRSAVDRSLDLGARCNSHRPDRGGLRPSLGIEIGEIDRRAREDDRVPKALPGSLSNYELKYSDVAR